jgi:glutathione S-transferase
MLTLYHQPFSAASRFARLVLAEHDARWEAVTERPWDRREAFLTLNPAATVPVLVENDGPPVVGPGPIMEYVDETRGYVLGDRRLMPGHPDGRAEMRRLVDWCMGKLEDEVTRYFVHEKIFTLEIPAARGGGAPDSQILRAARQNVRHHLRYFEWLVGSRDWIAGDRPTFADFACAGSLSAIDYLGEIPWDEVPHVKHWYQRLKSRPSFRGLLADKVTGLPAAPVYADLDF